MTTDYSFWNRRLQKYVLLIATTVTHRTVSSCKIGQQQTFLNETIFLNKILIFKQMGSEEKTLAQDGEQDIISIYAHLLDNHSPHH